jgi:hypothetical protein
MENSNTPGYLSEKLLLAYLGGCLPIYYGSAPDVFSIVTEKSLIFWDVSDADASNATSETIRYLEQNDTAYQERIAIPILKNGSHTIEVYFSLSEEIGNGALKWRIREMMNIYTVDSIEQRVE